MLYFFLSYAHGERDDRVRVQQFFNDLSTEIRVLTGEDGGTAVGFHDDGALRIGDDWPRELFEALCRAQTMIALFSPRYFRSEFCGKEWAVFSTRVRRWQQHGGSRQARLIPIFWVRRTRVPDVLGHLQHRDARFGDTYEREDLRELLREHARGHSGEYERFVSALALMITEIVVEGTPMPESDPHSEFQSDLRAVGSAFHPSPDPARPAGPVERAPVPEPSTVIGPRRHVDVPKGPPPRPILSLEEDPERPGPGDRAEDGTGTAPYNTRGGGHERR
ncbi:TIR domain-containing protein [Plantactinospora sp. S1510]|uniref:TIR domain-containing protein n=1 Tax=Plantactinospora alkalitolerans TaxID=2789879 RepID=A0ABS0GPC7_9ACTN|nr:TIR-like protein FxsC [Plantactinospora alkalitolerans]MBF9128051.1 TIR domain-containing protein [Plantactinospora alkalitolerans]